MEEKDSRFGKNQIESRKLKFNDKKTILPVKKALINLWNNNIARKGTATI